MYESLKSTSRQINSELLPPKVYINLRIILNILENTIKNVSKTREVFSVQNRTLF